MRYTSAGLPRHNVNATLCNSPPDRFFSCGEGASVGWLDGERVDGWMKKGWMVG